MELHFIGTGAAYYPKLGSTSAYLMLQEHLYLIDCGETVFSKIWNHNILKACHDVYVLVTHLHSDHIGSLGSFISYTRNILKKDITILTMDDTIVEILRFTGLAPAQYTFWNDFNCVFPGDLQIEPQIVVHDKSMKCYGYILSDGINKYYYGGDSEGIPSNILNGIADGSITRAYQEVTYQYGTHAGHTSLEQLCKTVPSVLRNRIMCMHLGGDYESHIIQKGFSVAHSDIDSNGE